MWQGMFDQKVLLLALNYFGIVVASLGMLIFVPQIIKSLGTMSNMTVGWLTMIPYITGGIGLVVWGKISDRMNERRWNLLAACLVSTVGLIIAGMTMGTWWAMVGLSHRDVRVLRLEGTVLVDAADVPDRHRRGGLHCLDQFDRQSRRLLWALVCRRGEGPDRQLRRRPVWPGVAVRDLLLRLCVLPAHSQSDPRSTEAAGAHAD